MLTPEPHPHCEGHRSVFLQSFLHADEEHSTGLAFAEDLAFCLGHLGFMKPFEGVT